MNRMKEWLSDFPTTSARILFTLGVGGGTALVALWCFGTGVRLEARTTAWGPPADARERPALGAAGAELAQPRTAALAAAHQCDAGA